MCLLPVMWVNFDLPYCNIFLLSHCTVKIMSFTPLIEYMNLRFCWFTLYNISEFWFIPPMIMHIIIYVEY
jgi:hypothetical protein